jgi:hypothetical protein
VPRRMAFACCVRPADYMRFIDATRVEAGLVVIDLLACVVGVCVPSRCDLPARVRPDFASSRVLGDTANCPTACGQMGHARARLQPTAGDQLGQSLEQLLRPAACHA